MLYDKKISLVMPYHNEEAGLAQILKNDLSYKDSQSGMWVFKRSILSHLNLISNSMAFSEEIKIELIKNGYKFKEINIPYYQRVGSPKLKMFKDGFKNFIFLFYKRFF